MLTYPLVDWQMMEGIGGVATALAVLVALGFGIVQLRLMAGQRKDLAAAEVLRGAITPGFIAAVDRIMMLPDDAPADTVARDEDLRRAVLQVGFTMEMAGAMVHARLIPLHEIDLLMGGIVRAGWNHSRSWFMAERVRLRSQAPGEWWQWLVERMEENPAPGKKQGAHAAFKDWKM